MALTNRRTYNFIKNSTQYKNGVDTHIDWGASQFLSKLVMVGLVGYVYMELDNVIERRRLMASVQNAGPSPFRP